MAHYDEMRDNERKQARPKNKGGRPKKLVIDYQKLQKMCAIHCTGEECAALLDVDYDTLNRTLKEDGYGGFTDYFKKYSAGGKMSLRRKQFEKASEGNIPMLIWLGKQYLGQKDQVEEVARDERISSVRVEVIGAGQNNSD